VSRGGVEGWVERAGSRLFGNRLLRPWPTECHDVGAQSGVGSQNPVVAMAMEARGWDELGDGVEELEWREQPLGAAVDVGFGEAVDETAVG
jgi:hypothetical protein